MGTRNLTIVRYRNEYLLAQYCQWDGYPEGQGSTVLEFLRDKMDRYRFLNNLEKCYQVSDAKLVELWAEFGHDIQASSMVSYDTAQKFGKKYPQLHRDLGADVLELVQNSDDGIPLNSGLDFAADSLFCEWAYVIDFDLNNNETGGVLEVYQGFNETPLEEGDRFKFLQDAKGPRDAVGGETYYPIRLKQSWPLNDLPSNEAFIKALDPPQEEEAAVEAGSYGGCGSLASDAQNSR